MHGCEGLREKVTTETGQTYDGIIAMRPRAMSRILCRVYMRRVLSEAGG